MAIRIKTLSPGRKTTSKLHYSMLLFSFVALFLLSFLHDKSMIQMITSSSKEISSNQNPPSPDTSIIVSSNLIPTHPSIAMINSTMHSLHTYLNGLPFNTPVYITVDGLPDNKKVDDNEERRLKYIQNLRNQDYHPFTNVQVLPMPEHFHLAGSMNHTLVLYVKTEFVYLFQHDLPFCRPIDHPRLIKTMRENPRILYNVRFRVNNNSRTYNGLCPLNNNSYEYAANDFNGLEFFATTAWSDMNQIARREYYLNMLDMLVFLKRFMEAPMQVAANKDCIHYGQQIYGKREDEQPHIKHLDGRAIT